MNTINIPVLALRGMTAFPGETASSSGRTASASRARFQFATSGWLP